MRSVIVGGIVAAVLFWPGSAQAGEQKTDFTKALRDVRQGVFLVGAPGVGHGTAWVISKKYRLLATNAHVADMFFKAPRGKFLAMLNGTDQTFVVEKVWYHPGVKRYPTKDQNISVRSVDANFGPVDPLCPDVAVLQLGSDGPPLPVELKFAPSKVLFDLQALPSAMLGYPASDTFGWPQPGKKANATFHVGAVSRVTDYLLDGGARDELAQCLQYSMESQGGFSGSPVFLSNGEVIALHNMMRTSDTKGGATGRRIAHGVRVDVLWELLVHHKLVDRVPIPVSEDKLFVKRWRDPDPAMEVYRKLWQLVEDANYLVYTKLEFAAGIAKCDEAIKYFPRYAPAYRTRCDGYNNWYFQSGDKWTAEKRLDFLKKALNDANKNRDLHRAPTVDALETRIVVLNNLGRETKNKQFNSDALETAQDILDIKDLTIAERSSALSTMANSLAHLGKLEQARLAYLKSLQTDPDSPILWENRAGYFAVNKEPGQAQFDRAVAKALRKKEVLLKESGKKDFKVVSTVNDRLASQDSKDKKGCHYHVWSVDLEAGYYYQIDLKNPTFKNDKDYDPILRVADDKGKVLAEDDDGGAYPNARIFMTPTQSGTYRLMVTSYLAGQTGPYRLTVVRLAKDQ